MAYRLILSIAVTAVIAASMTGCSRRHSSANLSPERITAHIPHSSVISPFAHPSANPGLIAGDRAVAARNYDLAMSLYQDVAQHADRVARGQAEMRIAYLYLYGMGRVRDPVAGLRHMQAAAELGDPFAEANLASLYSSEADLPHDYDVAERWAEASAAQGVTWSMDWMGWNYLGGYGMDERDLEAARRWYQKSADLGDAMGENQLGWLYLNGMGVTENLDRAMELYRRSASQSDRLGEFQLGWIDEHVKHDYLGAITWYLKAADQGDATAKNNIGYMYENGLGVPQDFAVAARWYERAASSGYSRAEYHLATLYARGLGVPKDLAKARELAGKAAESGDTDAMGWLVTHVFAK